MDPAALAVIAQFGFPAVVAFLIWRAYQDLAPKLLAVLEKTAEMNERNARALDELTRSIDTLVTTVTWLEKQMLRRDQEYAAAQRAQEDAHAKVRQP